MPRTRGVSVLPDDSPDFEIAAEVEQGVAVLRVAGELDLATAPELEGVLREHARARTDVALDLSAVSFMDSTGIQLLVEAMNLAKQHGWGFAVKAGISAEAERVLQVTGILPLLPLVE